MTLYGILEDYTQWLLKHGYCDDDVWAEPQPRAVDRFLKDHEYLSPQIEVSPVKHATEVNACSTSMKHPEWCTEESDGTFIGTCWGVCSGLVEKEGEAYCKECEYYKPKTNKVPNKPKERDDDTTTRTV